MTLSTSVIRRFSFQSLTLIRKGRLRYGAFRMHSSGEGGCAQSFLAHKSCDIDWSNWRIATYDWMRRPHYPDHTAEYLSLRRRGQQPVPRPSGHPRDGLHIPAPSGRRWNAYSDQHIDYRPQPPRFCDYSFPREPVPSRFRRPDDRVRDRRRWSAPSAHKSGRHRLRGRFCT